MRLCQQTRLQQDGGRNTHLISLESLHQSSWISSVADLCFCTKCSCLNFQAGGRWTLSLRLVKPQALSLNECKSETKKQRAEIGGPLPNKSWMTCLPDDNQWPSCPSTNTPCLFKHLIYPLGEQGMDFKTSKRPFHLWPNAGGRSPLPSFHALTKCWHCQIKDCKVLGQQVNFREWIQTILYHKKFLEIINKFGLFAILWVVSSELGLVNGREILHLATSNLFSYIK